MLSATSKRHLGEVPGLAAGFAHAAHHDHLVLPAGNVETLRTTTAL